MKVVIIGGVAGGATAAARLRRLDERAEIIIQERTGLSQSTTSLYLAALQRAQLVTSQRIGPWTYYKRHDENIDAFLKALQERI